MLGLKFVKFEPGKYVLKYRGGKIRREGEGLSFFYYAPTTSLVAVPMGSADAPFIFTETTADFQEVTIQGQITYRVSDPKKTATMLNYTIDPAGLNYVSDDPEKLPQRVINAVQVLTKNEIRKLPLKEALRASEILVAGIKAGLAGDNMIVSLGLEILGVSVLAIKPNPETAQALEAEAREQILKESDEAIFRRRNAAVEQERAIKENELNTEIAVENKNREIREKQMESEKLVQEKQQELEADQMAFNIGQEEKRSRLVELETENEKKASEARAHAVGSVLKAYEGVDPKVLQTLANSGMESGKLIALAFQGLADNADKIGQLNISPDLLNELLREHGS